MEKLFLHLSGTFALIAVACLFMYCSSDYRSWGNTHYGKFMGLSLALASLCLIGVVWAN